MRKKRLDTKHVDAQIEEVAKKYSEIKKTMEVEIAEIAQKLMDVGISGSTVVKLRPIWNHDVAFLLRKESEGLAKVLSQKAS